MSDGSPKPSSSLVPNSNTSERVSTFSEPSDAFRAEARNLFRQHRKQELVSAAIAAFVSAFAVAILVYIFGTQPMAWAPIGAGLAAAVLSVPITLLILYMYYRLVGAPTAVYVGVTHELADTLKLLAEEWAKNSDAQISGEILEYSASGKYERDKPYTVVAMYFSAKIAFVNNSPARTSIKNFYMAISLPDKELVSNYSVDGPP